MEVSEQLKNKLVQFQGLQRQAQLLAIQKQEMMLVDREYESALEELGGKTGAEVYKMAGPIMVRVEADKLSEELSEKRANNKTRLELLEKQEKKVTEKLRGMGEELKTSFNRGEGGVVEKAE